MASQQMLDYIKQRLAQGATKAEIKGALADSGWAQSDIDEGFKAIESPSPISRPNIPQAPSMPSAPVVAEPVQPFSTFSAQTPNTKSKLPFIILAVVGLFLIGGGAFAYYYFNTPEMIIKRMVSASEKVKSLEYQGEIDFEISGGPDNSLDLFGQQGKFTMNFSGTSDHQNASNSKESLYFDINAAGSALLALEMRKIDKVVYLNLINAPILEILGLDSTINQWIKIDTETIKNEPGFEDSSEKIKNLSPEKIEKINKLIQESKIFKTFEKMPSEKIEGMNNYHYKIPFVKNDLKKLFMDAGVIINDKPLIPIEIEEIDVMFDDIELIEGEIWIGKKDLLPRKIILNLKIQQKDPAVNKINAQIIAKILFKNYNKQVQVETPSPVKDFREAFAPLFSSYARDRDTQRMFDMRRVADAQEMYYIDVEKYFTATSQNGTPAIGSYLNPLSDPQGAVNPYKWLNNTNCKPSGQAFCAYAKLEDKGNCLNAIYFAASEKGTKSICDKAPSNGCKCF